jgi:hypothetical protein
MPSNCARIDIDLVQPTQYNISPDRKAKKLLNMQVKASVITVYQEVLSD